MHHRCMLCTECTIYGIVLQRSGIGMAPSILTSVVGAASEVVAVAEPVA